MHRSSQFSTGARSTGVNRVFNVDKRPLSDRSFQRNVCLRILEFIENLNEEVCLSARFTDEITQVDIKVVFRFLLTQLGIDLKKELKKAPFESFLSTLLPDLSYPYRINRSYFVNMTASANKAKIMGVFDWLLEILSYDITFEDSINEITLFAVKATLDNRDDITTREKIMSHITAEKSDQSSENVEDKREELTRLSGEYEKLKTELEEYKKKIVIHLEEQSALKNLEMEFEQLTQECESLTLTKRDLNKTLEEKREVYHQSAERLELIQSKIQEQILQGISQMKRDYTEILEETSKMTAKFQALSVDNNSILDRIRALKNVWLDLIDMMNSLIVERNIEEFRILQRVFSHDINEKIRDHGIFKQIQLTSEETLKQHERLLKLESSLLKQLDDKIIEITSQMQTNEETSKEIESLKRKREHSIMKRDAMILSCEKAKKEAKNAGETYLRFLKDLKKKKQETPVNENVMTTIRKSVRRNDNRDAEVNPDQLILKRYNLEEAKMKILTNTFNSSKLEGTISEIMANYEEFA